MRRLLLICIFFVAVPFFAEAQEPGCNSHFSGSDKSDFERGVEAYNNKRFSQCITIMRKLTTKYRNSADAYFYLGVASIKNGEKPATIRNYFNKLFKYCPDYPNALAYYYMGVVHYSYKEYDEAVEWLNRYFDMTNEQPNPAYDAVYEEASGYLYWSEFLSEAQRNQAPFNPVVIRGVSSRSDEFLPYLSPDGKELYFLREVPAKNEATFYTRQHELKVLKMYMCHWKDTSFNTGEPLPSPFNEHGDEGSVTMTADGNLMYYSMAQKNGNYTNCDIYYSVRRNGIWQPLQNAGRNVNGEHTWESQPSITPDGQYLYFASNRDGGYGGTDIWVCRRLPNGDWSRAENLGPAVNTPGNEKCPFIHADGKTLYFASNGWQGFGGYDLYFINITDTYLQRPNNLGLPINTEDDDIFLGVTTDGHRGYFAGRSTEWTGVGGTDIFSFELYPAAQPEEMSIVTGQLHTADGRPLKGTVLVLRQNPEADRYIVENDKGLFALALSAKGNNAVVATAEGYMPKVYCGNAKQLRRDLNAADFNMLPAELWGRYPLPLPKNGNNLLPLSNNATTMLDAYVDYLLSHPKMHIRIEATRIEEAKAIYEYFLSHQMRSERFEYKANSALAAPQLVITQM